MGFPKIDFRKSAVRKCVAWIVVIMGATTVAYPFGKKWIQEKIESELSQQLEKKQLTANWKSSSWNPWSGLKLTDLEIRNSSDEHQLLAKLDNLRLHFPLRQFLGTERFAQIQIRDASVTLSDVSGSLDFRNVSLESEVRSGIFTLETVSARHQDLAAELSGTVTTSPSKDPPKPLTLDLRLVRITLAALDFSDSRKPFTVTGSFEVDAAQPSIPWKAKLQGSGKMLVWKGIRLTQAIAEAELSSNGSQIDAQLASSSASVVGKLTRADWKNSPFVLQGTLKDSSGNPSGFDGTYKNRLLEIQQLKGSANLWEVAHDFPMIAEHLPKAVTFPTFPPMEIHNIRSDPETGWSIESAKTVGTGTMEIARDDQNIAVRELSGGVSYQEKTWKLEDVKAEVFSGNLAVSGHFSDGAFRQSDVSAEQIKLSEIKQAMGKKNPHRNPGVLAFSYQGSIDVRGRKLVGKGSMSLENAPVIEVPLLDPVYDIFAAILPGIERAPEGRFEADFTGKSQTLQVDSFTATGGSLTVDAEGDLNLKTGKVQGTARGKLGGLPGILTRPLSRLLEMEVTGSYDNINAEPLNPAKIFSNAATGAFDAIGDALKQTQDKIEEKPADRDDSEKTLPRRR
jgi:hypothetical protein